MTAYIYFVSYQYVETELTVCRPAQNIINY